MKNLLPDPQQIHELDVAIARGVETCRPLVDELVELVQTKETRFIDLKKDNRVNAALRQLGDREVVDKPEYEMIAKRATQWQAFFKAKKEPTVGTPSKKTNSPANAHE